ncbi:ArsA family ATPase [Frankia sp. CNm7]|uniref:ArsA family ATPase n=1 Tax=Frankia nepalensis TaxID=1836974 RepID=A0A937RJX3_9ACTN|nr:ArsA family ATPase [Frankia nepalensis]MBL7514189.1 ArsA family ATPase [Frankia nepalensis]MBL7522060.1 ArsA family ATPase [Frankia nepalensis]MBL7631670.1 ArsA family ATPase [Frankia nepalensis]
MLFTGKGGGGTTTVAAATATLAAQRGHRTLLVSFNPVGGLAATLDHPVSGAPEELEPGLFGVQIDLQHSFERRLDAIRPLLDVAWAQADLDPIEAEELAAFTGVGEMLALLELRDHLLSDRYDLVVVDAGPAADALRLLSFPETLSWYCRRLLPPDGRFVRWIRPSMSRSARLATRVGHLAEPVYDLLTRLRVTAAELREVLTDPARTSVRLVLTPETSSLAVTRQVFTALSLHGLPVDAVVANRVIGAGGGDVWRAGWAAAHREQLGEIEAAFAPLPVLRAAYRGGEPVGLEELAAFGAAAYGSLDPAGVLGARAGSDSEAPRVERTADGYAMSFGIPFADRGEVDLARMGDELVVTVGPHRRLLALPAALRRCDVRAAWLRDNRLVVSFVPDPDQWVHA